MKNPLVLSLVLLFLSFAYSSFSQTPANDNCGVTTPALPVGVDCTPTAGTLYNSNTTTTSGTGACGTQRDVWYRFQVPANSTSVKITVTLTSSPSTLKTDNTYIELLNGNTCPATGTSIGGCNLISSPRTYGNLTAGATYLFRVSTTANVTSGGASAYNFNVCIISNDNCGTANTIVPGSTIEASLAGASTSASTPQGCATVTADDDVWYKFTAVQSYATIQLNNIGSNLASSAPRIQLYSGACGSLVSMACGTTTINTTALNAGVQYYIRVYSQGAGQTGSNWGFYISVFPSAQTQVTGGRMKEVFHQQIISGPQAFLDPWEVTYGPDDNLWITESKGYRVYKVNPVTGVRDTVLDISQNSTFLPLADRTFNCQFNNGNGAQGGCAGLALHPNFLDASNPQNFVYISYVHSQTSANVFTNRIVRFFYNTSTGKLESPKSICDTLPGSNDHNSQRMLIAPVGSKHYLFYASGDMGAGQFGNLNRAQKAQMINSYEGKILRFNLEPDGEGFTSDGWIPSTGTGDEINPYNATLGVQSAVWAIGIRNNQGFAYDSVLDKLYGSSHGPFSDDEINVIERNANYGHPLVIGYTDGNVNGTTAGAAPGMSPPHPGSCPVITDEAANAASLGTSYRDPLFSGYPNSVAFPSINTLWNTTTGGNGQWPSEGWSGLALYSNIEIPGWHKSLVAASLKWGRLVRVRLNGLGTATAPANNVSDTSTYFGSTNRFRDLAFAPNGRDIYVIMDRSPSTSGPSALNPTIAACAGCLQKYTFLGYASFAGKSTIPTSIDVTNGTLDICNTASTITIDNTNNTLWVPITGPDGNIMAEIYPNGQNLGTVTASFYKHGGAIRTRNNTRYLDRNITITPQTQPSGTVKIRLYFSKAEYDRLDADPLSQITALADVKIHKNDDPCRTGILGNLSVINPVFSEAHGANGYMLQADISGFSSFYFGAASLALPVNLVSFTGTYKNDVSYLNWETDNEVNTDHFVVERSIGNSIYEPIGTVFAKGGTSQKTKYALQDKDAGTMGYDKLYYRLRINDRDGSYTYSDIVTLNIYTGLVASVSVFPNPTENQSTILVSSPKEQRINWQLVDITGRVVMSKEVVVKKGDNRIALDMSELQSGVYYLQVTGPFVNALEKIQKR